jgi:hypothetical protein
MKLKEIIGKMTPEMFGRGESANAPLASLKEAWPKQRRNTTVLIIVGAAMLIASIVLAAEVGGAPVIPCWVVFGAVAASLRVRKWNRLVKDSLQTLGRTRKDFKDVLRRLKTEYEYFSPWKTFGFYAVLVFLLLFNMLKVLPLTTETTAATLLTATGAIPGIVGAILLWRLDLNGKWWVVAASVLIIVADMWPSPVVPGGEEFVRPPSPGYVMMAIIPLILMFAIIPIIKEKRRIKNM